MLAVDYCVAVSGFYDVKALLDSCYECYCLPFLFELQTSDCEMFGRFFDLWLKK